MQVTNNAATTSTDQTSGASDPLAASTGLAVDKLANGALLVAGQGEIGDE